MSRPDGSWESKAAGGSSTILWGAGGRQADKATASNRRRESQLERRGAREKKSKGSRHWPHKSTVLHVSSLLWKEEGNLKNSERKGQYNALGQMHQDCWALTSGWWCASLRGPARLLVGERRRARSGASMGWFP